LNVAEPWNATDAKGTVFRQEKVNTLPDDASRSAQEKMTEANFGTSGYGKTFTQEVRKRVEESKHLNHDISTFGASGVNKSSIPKRSEAKHLIIESKNTVDDVIAVTEPVEKVQPVITATENLQATVVPEKVEQLLDVGIKGKGMYEAGNTILSQENDDSMLQNMSRPTDEAKQTTETAKPTEETPPKDTLQFILNKDIPISEKITKVKDAAVNTAKTATSFASDIIKESKEKGWKDVAADKLQQAKNKAKDWVGLAEKESNNEEKRTPM